jgi:hypothetical protein
MVVPITLLPLSQVLPMEPLLHRLLQPRLLKTMTVQWHVVVRVAVAVAVVQTIVLIVHAVIEAIKVLVKRFQQLRRMPILTKKHGCFARPNVAGNLGPSQHRKQHDQHQFQLARYPTHHEVKDSL